MKARGRQRLVTQKAYADMRNISPQAVNKMVRAGKIFKVGNKIDVHQADSARVAFARVGTLKAKPARGRKAEKRPKKTAKLAHRARTHAAPRRDPGHAPEPQLPTSERGSATESLTANRAVKEYWDARRARIDTEEREGKLLPVAAVLEAERRKNENIRNLFRQLPSTLAPIVKRLASEAEVRDYLQREIDFVLERLAKDPLGMQEISAAVMPSEPVLEPAMPIEIPPATQVEAQP